MNTTTTPTPNDKLVPRKLDNYRFLHPVGEVQYKGFGVFNTETNGFLTFDEMVPFRGDGRKSTMKMVASTLLDVDGNKWISPIPTS